jgi:hypothetical protein
MRVYYFGNTDIDTDNQAHKFVLEYQNILKEIEFIEVKPNQDLPFVDEKNVIILDAIENLDDIKVLNLSDFSALKTTTSVTAHDYDLGFQLKYLKKLNKLDKVIIVGLPMSKKFSYKKVQSTLRKLVAQDIHGS